MENSASQQSDKEIVDSINNLAKRLTRIENYLKIKDQERLSEGETGEVSHKRTEEEKELLEFEIGQFWFAKVGIVILAIGVIFLLTLPYENLPSFVPSLFGFAIVTGLFLISHLFRNSFEYVSRYLFGGGLLLLYFTILRLHFFSPDHAITSITIELVLLVLVVVLNLFISIRRKSVYLTSLNLTLGFVTALVSGSPYFLFLTLTILSALTVYIKYKMDWINILILGIALTYLTHLIWALGNPILGNAIQLVQEPQINVYFILVYAMIFAAGNFSVSKDVPESYALITAAFLNTVGSYGLFLLITLSTFNSYIVTAHFVASIVYLLLSFVLFSKHESQYSTFFYAIIGYSALSVAIINRFEMPDLFVVLCWQSIVVISTAIWFRSKIIIVANFTIFVIILVSFVSMAGELPLISLSFGIVALVSARLLNWKKHRLELTTELMRNAYLGLAFLIIPYSLYHSVPDGYLIFSWVAVTILYYILSVALKNKKYRWMGHLTLLLTVLYSVIIGTTQLEPTYRILSFLLVGIVLVVISLVYTKLKSKMSSSN